MAKIDIEQVAAIIREVADTLIMPRWRNLAAHEIGSKSRPDDIVTIADREAETELTRRLAALLPGSKVVGEEAVAADAGILELFRGEGLLWVIDPIDGTRKFADGKPAFDVLVALIEGGRGVAGWILAPAEGDHYMGEAGGGVVHRRPGAAEQRVRATSRRALGELQGIVTARAFANRGLADPEAMRGRFRGFSPHLCAGHNYGRLLRGECDFLINFATLPWDHLAGLTLAAEAGFHGARHDGARYDPLDTRGGILVAPDARSWREILAMLLRPG